MAPWHYDRLSAQDNSFLLMERGNVRMHVASTNICDMGPLRTGSGGIDIELVKRATMSIIHLVPRYRQRLFNRQFLAEKGLTLPDWLKLEA